MTRSRPPPPFTDAVGIKRGTMSPDLEPSPSGLFHPAAFERDVMERARRRPLWWDDADLRRRRYVEWVRAEALGLAAQVERLDRPDLGGPSAQHLRGLARLLATDSGWAAALLRRARDRQAA